MPKPMPHPTPLPSATTRSNCPLCNARLVFQRIIPGRSGVEHWTLRCTRCGHIHQDTVQTSARSRSMY